MIQVIINDFQSISEAKLKVDGITLIVGESNQGKSACLRAIQAACTNRFKAGQVRRGSDRALIRIKVPESDKVLSVVRSWGGGSPKVKLGTQVFDKLGRTVPKEVSEYLNLASLNINGEIYSCNFHPQFQKPLLLEFSQARVMEILSASSALDDLKQTKEQLLQERTKNKGAIVAVESIINEARLKVKEYEDLVSEYKPLVLSYSQCVSKYSNLEGAILHCNLLLEKVSKLTIAIKKAEVLDKMILISSAGIKIKATIVRFVGLQNKLHNLQQYVQILEQLKDSLTRAQEVLRLRSVISLSNLMSALKEKLSLLSAEQQKFELLSVGVAIQRNSQDIARRLSFTDQMAAKLRLATSLEENKQSLLKIVVNKECPVCGNQVKF